MIAIIGAMEKEVETLRNMLDNRKDISAPMGNITCGTLCCREVAVVKCGMGKVNMALCAQYLIDTFKPECIINTGIAGSLCNDIDIGDIVIGTSAVEHDMDATPIGDEPGLIGILDTVYMPLDSRLAEIAMEANRRVNPEIKAFCGTIATGDQFIADDAKKAYIKNTFGALCAEMEGGALAHVAAINHVPALVVRAVSDKADGSAEVAYFDKFVSLVIERGLRLICEIVKEF